MFEYNLVRQFISTEPADDDAIWQLSIAMLYTGSRATEALGSGSRWCRDPNEADDFLEFVGATAATSFVRGQQPDRVEMDLDQVR